MLAVAIFGYALDDEAPPFYILQYRVSYMLLYIGIVGAINMHGLIGQPF